MKILFVGLRVGAGLISICKAVKNELDKIQGVETEYVDIYSENPKMAKFASEFYYKIVKKFPRLVMFGQKIAYGCSIKSKKSHFFLNKDVSVCKEEMLKYIDRHKPDLIFTPVNFVAIALDELINEKKTDIKYIFQMPDFMVAYSTQLLKNCTYLISSCEEVSKILLDKDVNKNIVKTLGIPVDEKFYREYDRTEIIKQLECEKSNKFILISNGGAGFANNYKIVKKLYNKIGDYNLLVINGQNKKSKEKIQKFINSKKITNVINLGFVTNMPQLMYISDIMIGKCGSSSLCEASASGLKYIGLNNYLFPEIKNIEYIKKRKSAIIVKNTKGIKKAIDLYINNKEISNDILLNFKKINIENNLKDIVRLIINENKC